MKRMMILILTTALLLSACGCASGQTSAPESFEKAAETAAPAADAAPDTQTDASEDQIRQAESLLAGEKPVQPVDIRDADAFAKGHLPHAMLLDAGAIRTDALSLLPLKNTQLVVCGDADHSAQEAVNALKELGYLFVYPVSDMSLWTQELETGAWQNPDDKKKDFSSFIASDLSGLWVDETLFSDHDLTMINLWATFCGPCLMEMPDLAELNREYRDEGFQVVGIVVDALNADGTIPMSIVEQARGIVSKTSADYVHLLPTEQLVEAKVDEVMYVPETIFVNARGEIVGESYTGSRSGDEWRAIIEAYLKQVKS